MLVVGLVASPRKGMSTDTLVRRALEGARAAGAETGLIYLNDLEIRPCQACPRPPETGFCVYRDGMDEIYRVLMTADGLVVGTPAYYGSVSAQLKLVIDRCNCATEMVNLPGGGTAFRSRVAKRKKGAFIWVADYSRDPGHALVTMRLWCRDVNLELLETLAVTGADRGEGARNQADLLQRAFDLGLRLAGAEVRGESSAFSGGGCHHPAGSVGGVGGAAPTGERDGGAGG